MSGYYGSSLADFKTQDRVELHPATDLWMAGACYGRVISVGRKYVHVKLDRLRTAKRIVPEQLRVVRP